MVAKITSGSCMFGVLAYKQLKVNEKEATVLFTNRIIEPLNGVHHISQFQRSFEPYLIANKNTENPIIRPVNYQEGNLKTQISNVVKVLSKNYKYSSITEYKALLALYNITAEEVKI